MKAKNAPLKIQLISCVDLAPINNKLRCLFINIERELEKKAKENSGHVKFNQAVIFLRASTLSIYNCYETVCWLGSDVDEARKRPKQAMLTIPSITRTMIDNLATVFLILEDFLPRYDWYSKSSYREGVEELQRHKNSFGSDPKHQGYIKFFEQSLKQYASHLRLSKQETSNSKLLDYWPTLTQVINPNNCKLRAKSSNLPFLNWLNDWSYREISQYAHHSAWGISKIGSFLLKDMFSKEIQDRIEGDGIDRFRSGQTANAITVLLSFGSEVNAHFKLNHDETLGYIWSYLKDAVPVVQEAWDLRYKQLLSS